MSSVPILDADRGREASIVQRAAELFQERRHQVLARVDRMFLKLMIGQWVCGILIAIFFSPYAWEGKTRTIHLHVYVAVLVGGALSLFPVALAALKPGATLTRHVMAASQMLWSALFIHLTGGRIETHFHVFGSLAFLAFYYDWKVLNTATLVVASEHFLRGLLWPESIYGIANPEWWRFLEHAFWVVFTDAFLVLACLNGMSDMKGAARRQAEVEALAESDEVKSLALQMALEEVAAKA
jgi:hypothetical protein